MGASTSTLVLQASSNLTQAESNVLAAATNYEKSKVQLDLSTAATLSKLGIDAVDAQGSQVKHEPKVQGVVPADAPNQLTTPHLVPLGPGGVGTGPTMAPQPNRRRNHRIAAATVVEAGDPTNAAGSIGAALPNCGRLFESRA